MNAIYATATQSLTTISNFISDFCFGSNTEPSKRAQDFLNGLADEECDRFLAMTQAVLNVISAHKTLAMAAAYFNDSNDELIGNGLPFALAETLTALVNGYNNGEALSGVEGGRSWRDGISLLNKHAPSPMSDLNLDENSELKAAFFGCLEGKIEIKKVK